MQLDYLRSKTSDASAKTHQDRHVSSHQTNRTSLDNIVQKPEPLFLNELKPQQARDFLVSRLLKKLDATSLPNINNQNQNFVNNASPRDTANNIITSLNKFNQKSENPEAPSASINKLSNILHSAIDETTSTLNNVNALTPEIASEFEKIFNDVTSFINSLNNRGNETISSSSFSQYQSKSELNIQIETADGDIVTIDIAKSLAAENRSSTYSNSDGNGQFDSSYMEKNSSLSYSVIGDLDEEEVNSINMLIEQISKTTLQYEKGNVNAALQLAHNLKLEGDTLKAFEFNIQTSEQYRAIDLYERTKSIDTRPNTIHQDNIASSSAFGSVKDILSLATHDIALKDPINKIREIFNRFYEQLELDRPENDQQQGIDFKFTLDEVA